MRPWERVRSPRALPPDTAPEALQELDEADYAVLLRDHVIPRAQDRVYRRQWDQFWQAVGEDDELAERALDILEGFVDQAREDLDGDELTDHQRKRAKSYSRYFQDAMDRIERAENALSWAPIHVQKLPRRGQSLILDLVDAIEDHQDATAEPTEADRDLWAILDRLHLNRPRHTR